MRKLARFAAVVGCAAAVTVALIGSARTQEVSERIRQIGTDLGFQEADFDRLTSGEIVSRDLKEDSDKELALAVALVVKAPFNEVSDWIQNGTIDRVDETILSHAEIPDGAVSGESLASLKLAPGELDKLLKVEAGSDFRLPASEAAPSTRSGAR